MPDGAAAAAGGTRWSGGYGGRDAPVHLELIRQSGKQTSAASEGIEGGGGDSLPLLHLLAAVLQFVARGLNWRRAGGNKGRECSPFSSPLSSFIRAHRLGVVLHTTRPISRTRAARSAGPCEPWCCRGWRDSGALSDEESRLSLWQHVKTIASRRRRFLPVVLLRRVSWRSGPQQRAGGENLHHWTEGA